MCDVKNCRGVYEFIFYGHEICEKCWEKNCDGKINLKEMFGIFEKVYKAEWKQEYKEEKTGLDKWC